MGGVGAEGHRELRLLELGGLGIHGDGGELGFPPVFRLRWRDGDGSRKKEGE